MDHYLDHGVSGGIPRLSVLGRAAEGWSSFDGVS